jgi:perosamine synthetase
VLRALRRQLPVHSPLTARSILAAMARSTSTAPVHELESLLARRFHADRVILYGTGTQALTAAIATALETAGAHRPVALPGYTCYDVATAAVGADARILLYDLDPDTLAPDWESLERTLEAGAGVVVLAPLYGYPFDWSTAEALAGRHQAVLIEDAAQGAGATWGGDLSGTLGNLTTLSFGRGKGWTGGRGGALLIRGPAPRRPGPPRPPARTAALTLPAAVLAQWILARPSVYGLPWALPWLHLGETRYRDPSEPEAMTSFSAALIMATEAPARAEASGRQHTGSAVARALKDSDGTRPVLVRPEAVPGYLRVACRIPDPETRRQVLDVGGALGIEAGYPTTLAEIEAVRRHLADSRPGHPLPGARALARELITLPCHGRTTAADARRSVQQVCEITRQTAAPAARKE